jgi:hypothetical protein
MKMLVFISPISCDVGDGMTDSGVWTVPLVLCFGMMFELQDGCETCPIEVLVYEVFGVSMQAFW